MGLDVLSGRPYNIILYESHPYYIVLYIMRALMGKESISVPPYINVCEHAKTITKLPAGGADDRLEISKHVIRNII
jgi:hypothetical protein